MIDVQPALTTVLEAHRMLLVDCPLCDAPAPYDTGAEQLDCPACAVRLHLAVDETVVELAAA